MDTPADRQRLALAVMEAFHDDRMGDLHFLLNGLDDFLTRDLIMSLVSFIDMTIGPQLPEVMRRMRTDINPLP